MMPYRARILLVDDDISNLIILQKILEQEAYQVTTSKSAGEALQVFRKQGADIVLSDLRMPGMSGLELLRAIRNLSSDIPVVILTAFGTVDDAVEAMKLGAVDFLSKPIKRANVLRVVQDSLIRIPSQDKKSSDPMGTTRYQMMGQSSEIQEIRRTVRMLAPTNAAVFLQGESGTGKEIVARLIHSESGRSGQLVSVNCGAIPETLLESELFGYEKGAFTGAQLSKKGLFETADKGTLFLDEIGEMPLALQVKLLRVLEDGIFLRLGSTQPKKVDVRIIAATNANIKKKIEEGAFRDDLFFRLNVVNITIPNLRDRGSDVAFLAQYFLHESMKNYRKENLQFTPAALETIKSYSWPGNVRELKNVIERSVVLNSSGVIDTLDLKLPILNSDKKEITDTAGFAKKDFVFSIGTPLREIEREMIQRTLEATGGDKTLAAKLLGINLRTIYRKIQDGEIEA